MFQLEQTGNDCKFQHLISTFSGQKAVFKTVLLTSSKLPNLKTSSLQSFSWVFTCFAFSKAESLFATFTSWYHYLIIILSLSYHYLMIIFSLPYYYLIIILSLSFLLIIIFVTFSFISFSSISFSLPESSWRRKNEGVVLSHRIEVASVINWRGGSFFLQIFLPSIDTLVTGMVSVAAFLLIFVVVWVCGFVCCSVFVMFFAPFSLCFYLSFSFFLRVLFFRFWFLYLLKGRATHTEDCVKKVFYS